MFPLNIKTMKDVGINIIYIIDYKKTFYPAWKQPTKHIKWNLPLKFFPKEFSREHNKPQGLLSAEPSRHTALRDGCQSQTGKEKLEQEQAVVLDTCRNRDSTLLGKYSVNSCRQVMFIVFMYRLGFLSPLFLIGQSLRGTERVGGRTCINVPPPPPPGPLRVEGFPRWGSNSTS